MKIIGDTVIFSSGRTRYANGGRIGLSPELTVTEGYDGGFYDPEYEPEEYKDPGELLTIEDRTELADYMIEQWQRFKDQP